MIKETPVINENNPARGTAGGDNTTDKIFLLSLSDVFNISYGFSCISSDNHDARKAYLIGSDSGGYWWLRSPGINTDYAATVNDSGMVSYSGGGVGNRYGIRPALHINLSSSA